MLKLREKEKGMAAPTLKGAGDVERKRKGSPVFPKEGGQQRSEDSAHYPKASLL